MSFLLGLVLAALPQDARFDPLKDISLDQRLGESLPLDAKFVDTRGESLELGDLFGERPVILTLVYYECPMLCNLVLNGLVRSLRALGLDAGDDFEIVAISIDPQEEPAIARAKMKGYVEQVGRGADGWNFLVGDEPAIRSVAEAVGFQYRYDPETDEYAHAAGIMVATPQGRLSRYYYGVEYSARDLRLGLIESSNGTIGSAVDRILLLCFHYDPERGKYGLAIMTVMRICGIATAAAMFTYILRKLMKGA